jgi:dTDP-4-dehydrorhamnose reductase
MKDRIYIAGGAGMLGEAFYRVFKDEFELRVTDINVNSPWVSYLDFTDVEAYHKDVIEFDPHFLFHLGALTDLEYCEHNPDEAYTTNTTAVEYAVNVSNKLNIPLVYVTTAGVFDGKKEHYNDLDEPKPMGHYARSKYLGELAVKEHKKDFLVCRAGWMMGGGPGHDKKFVGMVMRYINEGRMELPIVNDKFGTPTYTRDFAANVKALLEKKCWGAYNMACTDEASRIEIAKEIIKILGKEDEISIKEVPSDYFSQDYFAPRPASEKLINSGLNALGMNQMRTWKVCLSEYISTYYKDYLPQVAEAG